VHTFELPCEPANLKSDAGGQSALEADLRKQLEKLCDGLWHARHTCVVAPEHGPAMSEIFVPRSLLKDLKIDLGCALESAVTKARAEKVKMTKESVLGTTSGYGAVSETPSALAIKVDRMAYLKGIAQARSELSAGKLPLNEVVIELKRTHESGHDPASWVAAWLAEIATLDLVPLHRVRLALPTVLRGWDEPLMRLTLMAALGAGIRNFEIGNLGALHLLRTWVEEYEMAREAAGTPTQVLSEVSISSDFTLFALNRVSSQALTRLGVERVALSIENDRKDLESHLGAWTTSMGVNQHEPAQKAAVPEVILYKDTPLFIAESCSLTALHGGCPTAAVCGYRTLEIEDDEKNQFLVAHEACKSIVYGKQAFALSQHRSEFEQWGVRHFRADFLTRPYSQTEVSKILCGLAKQRQIDQTHSANHLRELL
jgi:putative protease